jgi:hypothetical protein
MTAQAGLIGSFSKHTSRHRVSLHLLPYSSGDHRVVDLASCYLVKEQYRHPKQGSLRYARASDA